MAARDRIPPDPTISRLDCPMEFADGAFRNSTIRPDRRNRCQADLLLGARGTIGPPPLLCRAAGPHAAVRRPTSSGGRGGPTTKNHARAPSRWYSKAEHEHRAASPRTSGRPTAAPMMGLGGSLGPTAAAPLHAQDVHGRRHAREKAAAAADRGRRPGSRSQKINGAVPERHRCSAAAMPPAP